METPAGPCKKANPMSEATDLRDELRTLKGDVSRLLNITRDEILHKSKTGADALSDQIKAALNELGETLREQESHFENAVSDRPMATLASAFALGVVVRFMLRRH